MNEQNLQYLSVSEIYAHPDNPRKDLGDLSELVESITENGIFQNLTVVEGHWMSEEEWIETNKAEGVSKKDALASYDPKGLWQYNGYTAIIGHRRLAASKIAGLEKVPCVVADLDDAEQLRTMLMENMQRADLTPYEQAQGFQMMIDLGADIKSLAKDTGFSQKTIKARLEWAKLDKDKFAEAASRQISLADLNSLSKIQDLSLRNKALDAIGTKNFQNTYQDCLREEEYQEGRKKWLAELEKFAKEMPEEDRERPWMKYRCVDSISRWNITEFKRPEDEEKEYFYKDDNNGVCLYLLRKEEEDDAMSPEEQARAEQREKEREKEGKIRSLEEKHYHMRANFLASLKPEMKQISAMFEDSVKLLIEKALEGIWLEINPRVFNDVMGLEFDEKDFRYDLLQKQVHDSPGVAIAKIIYTFMDDPVNGYTDFDWKDGKGFHVHEPNPELDNIYAFLCSLGYELSDEEEQMQNGTHPLIDHIED